MALDFEGTESGWKRAMQLVWKLPLHYVERRSTLHTRDWTVGDGDS